MSVKRIKDLRCTYGIDRKSIRIEICNRFVSYSSSYSYSPIEYEYVYLKIVLNNNEKKAIVYFHYMKDEANK